MYQVKGIILVLYLLVNFFISSAQSISGVVKDNATGEPLPFANVFVDNTTIGTVTDADGKYVLKGVSPGKMILAASFVGYITKSVSIDLKEGEPLQKDFSLAPQEKQLDEVELTSRRDRKWEKQLERFEEVFIGSKYDPLVSKTQILNPWAIDFEEGKASDGMRYFSATFNQPLEIENLALGYKLIYHLNVFNQTRNGTLYQGPVQFIEMDTLFEDLSKKWMENRQKAYQSSLRHLFKSMIRGDLAAQHFDVFQAKSFALTYIRTNSFDYERGNSIEPFSLDRAVRPGQQIGEFKIVSSKRLEVHYSGMSWPNTYYHDIYNPISWITLKGGSTEVTSKGVPLDPSDIVISGHMARARVAHLLPHNYTPGDTVSAFSSTEEIMIAQQQYKQNSLREKPHLITDKPYYYPGETIWFSGQMLYQNPLMADTLSRVLYVDLIDPFRQIVKTEAFRIENGKVTGQLVLPSYIQAGEHNLRAYTQWMENFPSSDITYQPLPIINLYETVVNTTVIGDKTTDPDLLITINTDKDRYRPRDKVQVSLSVMDPDGGAISSNLTVSVTDTLRVASVPTSPTLQQAYNWVLNGKPTPYFTQPEYQIEYGISVSGQFLNKKGEPEAANITIVQGEYEDYGVVAADSTGKFWASGLQFNDSSAIAMAAINEKGRPYGSVALVKQAVPEVKAKLTNLNLTVKEQELPQPIFSLPNDVDYTLLNEVVVESSKIEPLSERNFGFGPGDKTFTQEDIQRSSGQGVMSIIERGMPGFNRNGMYRKNYGAARGNYYPTPLVIIDGQRFQEQAPPEPGNTGVDYLDRLNPADIKSITVYTYNAGVFGMAGFDGVIMVETNLGGERQADEKPTIFNKDGFSLYTVKGYTPAQEFRAPDYSQRKESHSEPDTRTTIYWNPSLTTDSETGKAEFSFYAADSPTVYRIVVEGMTEDNTPVREVRYIEVRK
ncbi:MAG: TonB-dependent receptor [Imperialibacter sp.]|uniref:TonB-dependent receptor n=1 Tax=Imperialibacter sp. TaxID=2038411 RepID=UPI0032ED071A